MTTERDSLEVHVDICQIRYQQLEQRFERVETKVNDLNIDLQDFKAEVRNNFDEVKDMLTAAKDHKFNTTIGAASAIIVALVGTLGYMITHIK